MIVALVRHGRTEWNEAGRMQGRADVPLSASGREQVRAWRLPQELRGARFVSSNSASGKVHPSRCSLFRRVCMYIMSTVIVTEPFVPCQISSGASAADRAARSSRRAGLPAMHRGKRIRGRCFWMSSRLHTEAINVVFCSFNGAGDATPCQKSRSFLVVDKS